MQDEYEGWDLASWSRFAPDDPRAQTPMYHGMGSDSTEIFREVHLPYPAPKTQGPASCQSTRSASRGRIPCRQRNLMTMASVPERSTRPWPGLVSLCSIRTCSGGETAKLIIPGNGGEGGDSNRSLTPRVCKLQTLHCRECHSCLRCQGALPGIARRLHKPIETEEHGKAGPRSSLKSTPSTRHQTRSRRRHCCRATLSSQHQSLSLSFTIPERSSPSRVHLA
jgi:hypothetical protein